MNLEDKNKAIEFIDKIKRDNPATYRFINIFSNNLLIKAEDKLKDNEFNSLRDFMKYLTSIEPLPIESEIFDKKDENGNPIFCLSYSNGMLIRYIDNGNGEIVENKRGEYVKGTDGTFSFYNLCCDRCIIRDHFQYNVYIDSLNVFSGTIRHFANKAALNWHDLLQIRMEEIRSFVKNADLETLKQLIAKHEKDVKQNEESCESMLKNMDNTSKQQEQLKQEQHKVDCFTADLNMKKGEFCRISNTEEEEKEEDIFKKIENTTLNLDGCYISNIEEEDTSNLDGNNAKEINNDPLLPLW